MLTSASAATRAAARSRPSIFDRASAFRSATLSVGKGAQQMNVSVLRPYAPIACAAVAILAGCGSQMLTARTPPTAIARPARIGPARGGVFNARYSGSYQSHYCDKQHGGASFYFSGNGGASFLGRSAESGHMHGPYHRFSGCWPWTGTAVLASSRNPKNFINMSLGYESPCGVVGYEVSGGGGKFANATGSGTVTFRCSGDTYSDQWSGTISF
jgi:hypothetical protein